MTRRKKAATWVAGCVWVTLLGVGFGALAIYGHRPGAAADGSQWPGSTALRFDGPTLVVFVHGRCPCTKATLSELARITAAVPGVRPIVVAIADGENVTRAGRIAGTTVVRDFSGDEARRFGATTSGHAFLYAADGALRYHGGLTPSRAHEGDSAGHLAIRALQDGGDAPRSGPVYGCPLFGEDS